MLSKIISENEIIKDKVKKYIPPNNVEIAEIIEKNKKKRERNTFIEENIDDPVNAAKKKADEILSLAQEKYKTLQIEAETLKIKAEKEIRQKLSDEFGLKLSEAVKRVNQNFIDSLENLVLLKKTIYENSEKNLLDLIFKITGKIIEDEIKTNPEIVIDMLRTGFNRIKNSDTYEIRMNPDDFEILSKNKKRLDNIIRSGADIKFIKSDKIERGGCIIKTGMGEVISEPSKQLATIRKEIIGDS